MDVIKISGIVDGRLRTISGKIDVALRARTVEKNDIYITSKANSVLKDEVEENDLPIDAVRKSEVGNNGRINLELNDKVNLDNVNGIGTYKQPAKAKLKAD